MSPRDWRLSRFLDPAAESSESMSKSGASSKRSWSSSTCVTDGSRGDPRCVTDGSRGDPTKGSLITTTAWDALRMLRSRKMQSQNPEIAQTLNKQTNRRWSAGKREQAIPRDALAQLTDMARVSFKSFVLKTVFLYQMLNEASTSTCPSFVLFKRASVAPYDFITVYLLACAGPADIIAGMPRPSSPNHPEVGRCFQSLATPRAR